MMSCHSNEPTNTQTVKHIAKQNRKDAGQDERKKARERERDKYIFRDAWDGVALWLLPICEWHNVVCELRRESGWFARQQSVQAWQATQHTAQHSG